MRVISVLVPSVTVSGVAFKLQVGMESSAVSCALQVADSPVFEYTVAIIFLAALYSFVIDHPLVSFNTSPSTSALTAFF